MALLNRKILFVHINKSCGGIITKNLAKNGIMEIANYHRTLNDMLDIVDKNNIDKNNLFIFTIVRNPWERMLSMYLFYHKKNYNCPEFFSGDDNIDNDFNNWINYIYSSDFDRTRSHSKVNIFDHCFSNQLNWIKNHRNMINIYKIEELDLKNLFQNTLKLKNFDIEERVHKTDHGHYSNYYNNDSINLVRKHYQNDIDYFGYKFESIN